MNDDKNDDIINEENEEDSEQQGFESYNAFSEGIELGGLRSTGQIKVLMGFLVKNIDGAIKKDKIIEILQIHGLANYFDASQALDEMITSGGFTVDEDDNLVITPKGRAAVTELENEIPKTVRERALNDAIRLRTFERRESENKIEVEYLEKGANVTFTLFNGDDVLMKLTVYAADDFQVNRVRRNFLEDPVSLYAGIVSSLFT